MIAGALDERERAKRLAFKSRAFNSTSSSFHTGLRQTSPRPKLVIAFYQHLITVFTALSLNDLDYTARKNISSGFSLYLIKKRPGK